MLGPLAAAVVLTCGPASAAADATDAMRAGFQNPPPSARPRTWWHWLNGNITKDGIAKDLTWMQQVGLGGVQNFDANLATPQIVPRRLVYMSPEWQDAFRYAVALADEKGLEFTIAASPGWSETGGPWVAPQDGMKKLVWSETTVSGGKPCQCQLPSPPSTTGPFQTLRLVDPLAALSGTAEKQPPTYYADVAVLAVPIKEETEEQPRAASLDGKPLNAAALTDASLETSVEVDRPSSSAPGVTLTYTRPHTAQSVTFYMAGAVTPFGDPEFLPVLEAKDGADWRRIVDLPLATVPTTVSFAPVTAREFRIVIGPNTGPHRAGLGAGAPGAVESFSFPKPNGHLQIAEFRLGGEPRIDRFEVKAGFDVVPDYYSLGQPPEVAAVAQPDQVISLTGKMRPDGTLEWTPPKGRWRVIRLGWSLTGTTNHPATPEATGLEVDKYDGAAVRRYLEKYLHMYSDAVGDSMIGARGIRSVVTDSIEVGPSNWTPALLDQFMNLRGYDPRPWLPTLTGVIIGSRARSDAFLYDFRRTLADLIASQHYGTVAAVAHEHGLKVYGEALEDGRPSLGDDVDMRSHTDVPMAALWTWQRDGAPRPTLLGDMKGASSVAHLFGQNIAAAESMTSANAPWAFAPADLRRVIDLEFAYGINRPVIHTSVHQPVDDKVPGLSLAIFGQYFNRHETWATMARPWIDYIARNAFLLQQGRNVADIAYFFGEEQPLTALYEQAPPANVPTRYAYDFVNADVLINVLSVENGDLVAKSGARYRALYLGDASGRMTLSTLRRIAALAEAGATIIGEAPQASPSLNDDPVEFAAIVSRLWPPGSVPTTVGKGLVIASRDADAALLSIGVAPDFALYPQPQPVPEVLFVHRLLADGDIYFVDNRTSRAQTLDVQFRVSGKRPQIWRPDTGLVQPVSYRIESDRTVLPLELGPEDSFFVVFREPTDTKTFTAPRPELVPVGTLTGPWNVAFQPNRGAPASTRLAELTSLSDQPDPGVRFFSGIATYTRTFELHPHDVPSNASLWLDLGKVGDVAEVRVNGQLAGTAWKPPYRLDIGPAVHPGRNELEVRVANLWVNRLIGDAQPNATRITFTTLPTYRADAPLRPSGLMGPVRLLRIEQRATQH